MLLRVNIGCGQTPTKGWHNYDNSWSVRLARINIVSRIIERFNLLSKPQREFISFLKNENIMWADATKYIPERDESVDAIYSSHMIEHLDKEEVKKFLHEAFRVLKSGGIIRLVVPNIRYLVENYLKNGSADNFIEKTGLTKSKPKTLTKKLKYLAVGDRHHQWMYDGHSLCNTLYLEGFQKPQIMEPGSTNIINPGVLNLKERCPESVFVEAIKPQKY